MTARSRSGRRGARIGTASRGRLPYGPTELLGAIRLDQEIVSSVFEYIHPQARVAEPGADNGLDRQAVPLDLAEYVGPVAVGQGLLREHDLHRSRPEDLLRFGERGCVQKINATALDRKSVV